MRYLILVALFMCGVFGQNHHSIECPIAGNPDPSTVDQATCESYSSCEWINGTCGMAGHEAGYYVSSDREDTGRGYKVSLTKTNSSYTLYNGDINELVFEVIYHEDYHVQIKIYDPNSQRYEVPVPLIFPEQPGSSPLYSVDVSETGSTFNFQVYRTSTGSAIFNTHGPMSYEDQFIQLTTTLQTSYMYGLGEHSHTTLKHSFNPRETYPIFSRDQQMLPGEYTNHYGSHPYYVNIEDDDGNTHSVLLFNSNSIEYSMFEFGSEELPAITMRTIGGILDLHFFLGPTPEDVNTQYAETVGPATYPPYWAFGFHLSRFGYNSSDNYREVRDRMRAEGIPQDGQIFDIDYMDGRRDFTIHPTNWADLSLLIDELHAEKMHVALILDPALAIEDTYDPFLNGKSHDAFVRWPPGEVPADQPSNADDYMVGYVWPESKVVFPDFMRSNTTLFWDQEITQLHDGLQLDFDGLWIDMNEPVNFGTDTPRPFNMPDEYPDWSLKCPTNQYNDPPYPTLAASQQLSESKRINDKTLCMSAIHELDGVEYRHYDVHSLYGYYEARATFIALEDLFFKERPFILSRSTFPGVGKWAIHWLGDNTANWENLRQSVIGMLEFNMFALPMVGADVCGFFEDTTEELCTRWTQLGAFYPYNRNHNYLTAVDQDPANPAWPNATPIMRDVLMLRQKYLPFFYATFHRVHMNGHSAVRPLWNLFPNDMIARTVDDQFFWLDAMMIAPIMVEGAVERNVYFPEGRYYNLVNGTLDAVGPSSLFVSAPIEIIPVYLRGGVIIPYQEPALNMYDSRENPMGLKVPLDENLEAVGEVFWDDGYREHVMSETYLGSITFSNNNLTLLPEHNVSAVTGINWSNIDFYGFTFNPSTVTLNGQSLDSSSWLYDAGIQVLNLYLNFPINEYMTILLS